MKSLRVCLSVAVLLLVSCASQPEVPPQAVLENGHSGGSALATDPTSQYVVAGGLNGRVRLWRLRDKTLLRSWTAHAGPVTGVAFLDGGTRIVTTGHDGEVSIWSLSGAHIAEWKADSPISALALAASPPMLITGHANGSVRAWKTDGTLAAQWSNVHVGRVRAVTVDGQRIASSGVDGEVYWWTFATSPVRLQSPPTDARTLLFVPDQAVLLGAGWFDLYRWQLADGGLHVVPTEHDGIINDLAFTANGELASISRQTDSAVLLLDPNDGHTIRRFQRHALCGVAVAPSSDGRYLVTTSDDATVRVWDLSDGEHPPGN